MENIMNVFCHVSKAAKLTRGPLPCAEVTFHATPEMLRSIGEFLIKSADDFETQRFKTVDHFHFRDSLPEWKGDFADVIAMRLDP